MHELHSLIANHNSSTGTCGNPGDHPRTPPGYERYECERGANRDEGYASLYGPGHGLLQHEGVLEGKGGSGHRLAQTVHLVYETLPQIDAALQLQCIGSASLYMLAGTPWQIGTDTRYGIQATHLGVERVLSAFATSFHHMWS